MVRQGNIWMVNLMGKANVPMLMDQLIRDYKDGKRHGKGKFYYVTRAIYEGDFQDGKRHGKG